MSEMAKKQSPSTMKFSFYFTDKDCMSIPAFPDWTLEEAIKNAGGRLKGYSFKDHILTGQLNGPVGEAAILPAILCSKLKLNGKIRSKPKKDATIPSTRTVGGEDDIHEDSESEDIDPTPQKLLFVKSTNPGVTKIAPRYYDGKHLGVISYAEDTIEKALSTDGRFHDVQDLELWMDDDRQAVVELKYRASDYADVIFNAKKRPAKKRKRVDQPAPNGGSSTRSVNPSEEAVYSNMPQTLTQPFSEEFGRGMIQDARRSALKMFAEAGVEEDTDKYIRQVTKKFGKFASSSIPARILEGLAQAAKLVGIVRCGNYSASCFLLEPKFIITCHHVMNDIANLRKDCTDPETFKVIYINFNYDYPHQIGNHSAEVDETSIGFQFSFKNPQLDYVILPVTFYAALNLQPLGSLVRSVLPRYGLVTLIGHPEERCKSVEICSILPTYDWLSTLCSRAKEAEHQCEQNPELCHLTDQRQKSCVHIYKDKILELEHADQLPYDTSFFHGASGSPVFNADGHIVAMHTQGYPFYKGRKKVSLMEFGVTFSAIIEDIKNRYGVQHVKTLFPEIKI